jgi:2-oxoglutarate dehydrogenase E2 component (dihydrolipoamide succinyltransferase)
MVVDIKVPALPESVMDATVVKFYVQEGDAVEADAPLLDLETDKIVLEVPAPVRGVITSIQTKIGDIVESGQILALLNDRPAEKSDELERGIEEIDEKTARPIASPAANKIALENNIDLSILTGTGKNQRITKQDVLKLIGQHAGSQQQVSDTDKPSSVEIAPSKRTSGEAVNGGLEQRGQRREPMSRLRQRIAQRLLQVQHDAAILTTFNEVNMQSVIDARNQYRDEFEKRYGARLGFMSFFVKACAQALQNFPITNASIDENDIVYHDYIDIGIAVSSPRGLVVPILRDVQDSSFGDIETQILHLAQKARDGKLSLDDLTGGTFSITNGGVFGSMLSTPLLNPPQSAILGMHNITQRAVVEENEIVIRPMMYLALSYDHRLIDGRDAVQFLVSIKQDLEDPSRLLIGL